jgi:hypothetical protein
MVETRQRPLTVTGKVWWAGWGRTIKSSVALSIVLNSQEMALTCREHDTLQTRWTCMVYGQAFVFDKTISWWHNIATFVWLFVFLSSISWKKFLHVNNWTASKTRNPIFIFLWIKWSKQWLHQKRKSLFTRFKNKGHI